MKIHELKCWPDLYGDVDSGRKTAEFRLNDRGFEEGDLIDMREYVPTKEEFAAQGLDVNDDVWDDESWEPGKFTGERCWLRITHVVDASFGFGIPAGYAVLSVRRVRFETF